MGVSTRMPVILFKTMEVGMSRSNRRILPNVSFKKVKRSSNAIVDLLLGGSYSLIKGQQYSQPDFRIPPIRPQAKAFTVATFWNLTWTTWKRPRAARENAEAPLASGPIWSDLILSLSHAGYCWWMLGYQSSQQTH